MRHLQNRFTIQVEANDNELGTGENADLYQTVSPAARLDTKR